MKINITDIEIGLRKRKLDEGKVHSIADSFLQIGQLQPITVARENGNYYLIAGLHRLEAAKLLDWQAVDAIVFSGDTIEAELAEIDENLMRNDLTVLEQGEHLQRRNEILEAMGQRAPSYRPEKGSTVLPLKTTADIAKEVGLSETSAQRRMQVARNIVPEVKDAIRNTEIADSTTQLLELARLTPEKQVEVARSIVNGAESVVEAIKTVKQNNRKAEIEKQIEEIKSNNFQAPDKKYDVIVMDPPWPYGTQYDPNGRRAANPYPEMSLDEIAAIELPAADNCILWLWTTHKFMRHSFGLLDKWGFRDVAILTWCKDKMGLGSWLRSQSEFCIMAVKGSPKVNLTNQTTVLHAPMREHSRKPDEFYTMVDDLCIGYKIDWFSREPREGWAQFGNDTERF
jgi:N6-adenosine-specific RNA methylase IME4